MPYGDFLLGNPSVRQAVVERNASHSRVQALKNKQLNMSINFVLNMQYRLVKTHSMSERI